MINLPMLSLKCIGKYKEKVYLFVFLMFVVGFISIA